MLRLEALDVEQGGFELRADLSVEPGTFCAVIGPSGGGKSTLLSTISGFIAPRSGRVLWQGRDLTPLAPGARPITMVFQDNNLFGHLSAWQNVAIGLRPSMKVDAAQDRAIRAALARVGLSGMEERRPAELSGGQQSRVVLARVLVRRKPLLLLDEPFAALGPALRREMLDLVAELARDTQATVLMVTHDPADAEQVAEQVIFVDEGQVFAPVPTGQLLAAPPAALRAYLGERKTRP